MNVNPKSSSNIGWQGQASLQVSGIVHRGLYQSYPKKADIAKILASLIWPEYFSLKSSNPEINIFTTDELPLIDHLSQILRQPVSYTILQEKIDILIHSLINISTPTVMAFTGSWRNGEANIDKFAQVLNGLRPHFQNDLINSLSEKPLEFIPVDSPGIRLHPLLAQERPGRLNVVDLEADSLLLLQKKWKQSKLKSVENSQRNPGFYLTESGWGIGAAALTPIRSMAKGRKVRLSAEKHLLTELSHFMERGEILGEAICGFMRKLGLDKTQNKGRIFLGFRDMCSAGQLRDWLGQNGASLWMGETWDVMLPDAIGWHPAATIWQMMIEEEYPAIYVLVEDCTEVWLVSTEPEFC